MTRYRHKQVGWAILASSILPVLLLGTIAITSQSWLPFVAVLPLLLLMPVFGLLTVEVSDTSVDVRFGMGLFRRRVPLQDIASIQPVTTSWRHGWGIRVIPGGRLYNVSGTDAVELVLADGRKVWIGTDDRDSLLAALRGARGTLPASSDAAPAPMLGYTMLGPAIVVVIVLSGAALVLTLSSRPIDVVTSASDVAIHGAGYTARVPFGDIVSVHLDDRLPAISWRTNGAAFGGKLRGHFKLSDGRAAQLFVTSRRPPFITLETRTEPVIVNFDEPERTRALYEQLSARF